MRLNEDLAEAIALAHDLGHTPFGHSGEETLNQIMKDYGGFEHNRQGLRVVDWLEEKLEDHRQVVRDALNPALAAWQSLCGRSSLVDLEERFFGEIRNELLEIAGNHTPKTLSGGVQKRMLELESSLPTLLIGE